MDQKTFNDFKLPFPQKQVLIIESEKEIVRTEMNMFFYSCLTVCLKSVFGEKKYDENLAAYVKEFTPYVERELAELPKDDPRNKIKDLSDEEKKDAYSVVLEWRFLQAQLSKCM